VGKWEWYDWRALTEGEGFKRDDRLMQKEPWGVA